MRYTPMAEEVRGDYAHFQCPVGLPDCTDVFRVALAEFDRWLAALIREAKAEALEEASLAYGSGQLSGIFLGRDDYPKAWLRARAAEYREGSET